MTMARWRVRAALELLQKGMVTFNKAAEIARISLWEFADILKQRNIEWVKYNPEDVEKELQKSSKCS